jgi:hypothetical protein
MKKEKKRIEKGKDGQKIGTRETENRENERNRDGKRIEGGKRERKKKIESLKRKGREIK